MQTRAEEMKEKEIWLFGLGSTKTAGQKHPQDSKTRSKEIQAKCNLQSD